MTAADHPADRAVAHLAPQPWMTGREIQAVIAALSPEGGQLRFVGGCVRDSLLGRAIRDVDLATPLAPEEVVRRLEAAGLKAVPTGIAHGTVTAVSSGRPFEITTLREDLETDGRHARVGFTEDWVADAERRDFTINALSMAPDGDLFDPFGGRDDLAQGRIRFVGSARQRIVEDYLRILRFFRFQAWYGREAMDPETLAVIAEMAPGLDRLSAERVREELLRLLAAPDPGAVIAAMADHGVLGRVLPEAAESPRFDVLLELEAEAGVEPEALTRMALLLSEGAVAEEDVAEEDKAVAAARRLKFSNAQRATLRRRLDLARAAGRVMGAGRDLEYRRALQETGAEEMRKALLVAWSQAGLPPEETRAALLAELAAWREFAFPVTGHDLIAAGLAQGPGLGKRLRDIEDWWLSEDRKPDLAACLAWAKAGNL